MIFKNNFITGLGTGTLFLAMNSYLTKNAETGLFYLFIAGIVFMFNVIPKFAKSVEGENV